MDNKENTEQKILQAAITVFIKKGRYGAKMHDIADEAGINKALLHYYFRTKDKLYLKAFENVFDQIFGSLHIIFKSDDSFEEKLVTFVDQYSKLILRNPQIPLFILRELGEGAENGQSLFDIILSDEKFDLPIVFMANIQTAIKKGEIKKIDPRQLFITIIGSIAFFFIAEPLLSVFLNRDPNYEREAFIEQRKKTVVEIILNGIKL